MPNNDQTWQQAAQFVTNCFLMVYQQHQQQYIFNVWQNLNSKPKHALLKSGIDTEKKRAQNLVDQVFEYVAPSLFVTSVLASGELVGSTIWGISKYVSKDVIWDTLGATTAAVILQSAELVGYQDETQKLLGIEQTGKRAAFAIKVGDVLGKAIGAAAGTSLSVLIESFTVGLVAPTLVPFVTGAGFVAGLLIGGVIGAGVGAGLNNLFFSTIGIVPASYKGIKQKGGKFAERIKHSREVKLKSKQEKAVAKEQEEAKTNAVPVNEQGAGAPNVLPAQRLLEGGKPAQQPNPNAPVVLAVKANLSDRSVMQSQVTIAQQRNTAQNTSANEIPRKGGNKTGVGNPKGQEAEDLNSGKKKPRKKISRSTKQDITSVNNSGKNKTAAQTNLNKKVKQSPQPRVSQSPATTPKNTQTKDLQTTGQLVYKALEEEVTHVGGDVGDGFQKVVSKNTQRQIRKKEARKNYSNQQPDNKKNSQQLQGKFTGKIQPNNAIGTVLEQGKNNNTFHAQKLHNTSGQNSQSVGKGRSIK